MNDTYELVTVDGRPFVVKHEGNANNRKSCLAYLEDCGHVVTTRQIDITTWLTNPEITSFADLSDLIEPRDD